MSIIKDSSCEYYKGLLLPSILRTPPKVLFSGTPPSCQVLAGILLYKYYQGLLLAAWQAVLSTLSSRLRSEEHTSELQSHRDLHSFPTRRSSDLPPSCQVLAGILLYKYYQGLLLAAWQAVLSTLSSRL